jgi:hypothetical protein
MQRAVVGCGAVLGLSLCMPVPARADALASSLYVRTDSDKTVVVSPRARGEKQLGESTTLDLTYAVDVWTSASIDIRTSASPAVTEQRDEIDVAATQLAGDLTLTGSYRFSKENDYASHGGSAGLSLDFADNSSTLDLNLNLFEDSVGRSGDPTFSRQLGTVGARLAFTQVFDPKMLGQLTYEIGRLDGYQASPYRVVGVGGNGYGCMGATLCLPEHVPQTRLRHAFALLLRRALGTAFSLGANYRFYTDDWGLGSHTVGIQLGYVPAPDTMLTLRYRLYLQSRAKFYEPIYAVAPDASTFTTRDRELSKMNDHRVGLDLQHIFSLADGTGQLTLSAGIGGDFYSYAEFVGLDKVSALELTAAVTLEQ